ncbi:MAG: hypothetical protein WCF07_01280, partial [Nitrososphaeraceae archaeon]
PGPAKKTPEQNASAMADKRYSRHNIDLNSSKFYESSRLDYICHISGMPKIPTENTFHRIKFRTVD